MDKDINKRLDKIEKAYEEQSEKLRKIESFISENKSILEKLIQDKKYEDNALNDYLKSIN